MSTKLVLLTTVLIVLCGCSTAFERQFAAAERLRVEAAEAGAEWLETGTLLDQASEAADREDMDAAFLLLEQARFQSETAIKQAQYEADAWAGRVVR